MRNSVFSGSSVDEWRNKLYPAPTPYMPWLATQTTRICRSLIPSNSEWTMKRDEKTEAWYMLQDHESSRIDTNGEWRTEDG